MEDAPREDTTPDPDQRPTGGLAPWQKVVGIIGLVLVVVVILVLVLGGHTPRPHGAASPVGEGAVEIGVTADNLSFDPDVIMVGAGEEVAIVLTSVDMLHDFTIQELGAHVAASPGAPATGGFTAAQPGQYAFYCSVPGHREAGMEGTLLVVPEGESHEDLEEFFRDLHR